MILVRGGEGRAQSASSPPAATNARAQLRTAFFYAPDPPAELLNHYDRVVVDPDNARGVAPRAPNRAELFAYVSLGEVHPSRSFRAEVPTAWVLGRNGDHGSEILDTARPEWRTFVLNRVLEPLYQRGYRGFFFDTLDSYQRVAPRPVWGVHAGGLAAIVRTFRQRHPDTKVLLNRGFEMLPQVADLVAGVVAESLFATWIPQAPGAPARFAPVPEAETAALRKVLDDVRAQYKLPVTVIDYVPAGAGAEARRRAAQRILDAGFAPYVSSPALDEVGVGEVESVPRRVLLLYKGNDEGYLGVQDACVLIAPVLEWMGYRVDYADVRAPLPQGNLHGRYAGVVLFVPEGAEDDAALERFVTRQLDAGLRVAFVEGFGFEPDAAFLSRLGLIAASPTAKPPMAFKSGVGPDGPSYVGFETKPRAKVRERPPVRLGPTARATETKSALHLEDAGHDTWDAIVLGPWGGAAFIPYVLEEGLESERRWVLDPFRFLRDALALPDIPAPDVTTASGRRELTIHIDGDAFVSRAERRGNPYAGQVVLDEILTEYELPHTVSVVEAEVGPAGLYPDQSPALERIAREIFRLPNVEVASHTYSHPFFWADAEAGKTEPHGIEPVHLRIPGYKFSLERDIAGSIDYVNTRLAPPDKKVKVLLWPGDCSPSARAVALTESLGVFNVNGGGATRTRQTPSLTHGSAMGIPESNGAYQVFAPVENENVYTNDFLGPYYGYRRVIETFELNENPRRLGHITIYYHFYSAAKTAALTALKEVYAWAVRQETIPLYLSEYAAKVLAFQKLTLARRIDDGAWEIAERGPLDTLRLGAGLGWPDLARSTQVAGVRDVPQGRYVHLAPGGTAVLAVREARPDRVHLEHANGSVLAWAPQGNGARLRIRGHVPLVITVGGVRRGQTCTLRRDGAKGVTRGVPAASEPNVTTTSVTFRLDDEDTGEAHLECQ